MSSYELLLFLHIGAAIIWLGAAFVVDLLFWRAERTGDPAELGKMGELQDWLAPRLFIPASLATLVFGVLLVLDSPWAFGDLWVALGLVGFLAGFLTGILYLKPQGEKIPELAAKHGPTSPELMAHIRKLLVVARVQLLMLFLIVALMVIKPSTDNWWTLLVLAAIMLAGVAAGVAVLRREPAAGTRSQAETT